MVGRSHLLLTSLTRTNKMDYKKKKKMRQCHSYIGSQIEFRQFLQYQSLY
jgi:hypothetical protein